MSGYAKQLDELFNHWQALNPAKIPKSFGANESTIKWLKNSLPRVGWPDPEPGWLRRAETTVSFLGMEIVADKTVPRGELHVRNSEGTLLEVLRLPAFSIPSSDD